MEPTFTLFGRQISKKKLKSWALPVLIVLLLLIGLIRQGFFGYIFNSLRGASITVQITDETSQPLELARVILGQTDGSTDASGSVTITGLVSGTQTMEIRRSGFDPSLTEVKLRKGSNDLGTIKLQKSRTERVGSLSLKITDYISGDPITGADVVLTDLRPIHRDQDYLFTDVPIGQYQLSIAKAGYNKLSKPIELKQQTTSLDDVELVKSGLVTYAKDGALYQVNLDGGNKRILDTGVSSASASNPITSPDSTKIAFLSKYQDPSGAVYISDNNGKNLQKISSSVTSALQWSPDSKRLIFTVSDTASGAGTLKVYDVANKQLYGAAQESWSGVFAVSLDGNKIAYPGFTGNNGVYLTDGLGQNLKKIEDQLSQDVVFNAQGQVLYTRGEDSQHYRYDPASDTKTAISADDAAYLTTGQISPDGSLLARVDFISQPNNQALYLSDKNGNPKNFLVSSAGLTNAQLTWGKDNSYLLYVVQTDTETAYYVVSINGGQAKKVVDISL